MVLTEAILIPGIEIEAVLRKTRKKVVEATNGKQIPWACSSITNDFYFISE